MSERPILCIDVGSTFTKGLLVDSGNGQPLAAAAVPTTHGEVLTGIAAIRRAVLAPEPVSTLVCSSAGGGLRLAVVGYEASVTALAGERVGLSAGARVVHVVGGRLDTAAVKSLQEARPDLLLLVGGTDGGNADVLLGNAARIARARLAVPVVLAGNAEARLEAVTLLAATGRRVIVADNVLPRIGVIEPEPARAAIRETFLRHVIGGKRLSRSPEFARLVRCATPDAVLRGVEVLADCVPGDAMLIDVGGATTDVYSAISPAAGPVDSGSAERVAEVAPAPRVSRTVEADLGMRWSASGVLEAAARENLTFSTAACEYAARVARDVERLPRSKPEWEHDLAIATVAAVIAARRHGRPAAPGQPPRALRDVAVLIGSGGVLRHAPDGRGEEPLRAVLGDHGGGWLVPRDARARVDAAYVLFAVGLLAAEHPAAARGLATLMPSEVRPVTVRRSAAP